MPRNRQVTRNPSANQRQHADCQHGYQAWRHRQEQQQTDDRKFGTGDKMATNKAQEDERRRATTAASVNNFLGSPPFKRDIIEVQLVLPGKHMLPRGLKNLSVFDTIRTAHKVWITRPNPSQHHVFVIHGRTILDVQEAICAIHWLLQDLRLSNDQQVTRFVVQRSTYIANATIEFRTGKRPKLLTLPDEERDYSRGINALITYFSRNLPSAAEKLVIANATLRMRVNFGRVYIRSEGRNTEKNLTYSGFEAAMKQCTLLGGASLETRMADTELAEPVSHFLLSKDVCNDTRATRYTYTVALRIDGKDLVADGFYQVGSNPQLSTARWECGGASPRLHWVFAVPDMALDWSLSVLDCESSSDVSNDAQALLNSIKLEITSAALSQSNLKIPQCRISSRVKTNLRIQETRMKSSAVVPVLDTPYIVEISLTQSWAGLKVEGKPDRVWWSVELYGIRWDEAINSALPGQKKKDWGVGLEEMWTGPGQSMEERVGGFIRCIYIVQCALNCLNAN